MKTSVFPLVRSLPLPRLARPVLIVWVFVAIVVCLVGLTIYGSGVLSNGRAYLALEGERVKAEKDAIYHLTRFVQDGSEEDIAAFERAIGKIEKARGLRQLPVAGFAPTQRIQELSAATDAVVGQLTDIAAKARSGALERFDAANRVHRLNLRLAPLEDELAAEVEVILATVHSALASGILVITGLLLIAGILASRRFIAQNDRLQQTLAESENQLRHMVEAAPLPLLIVRASDKRLLYVNERALEQFDLDVDRALARTFEDFHVDPDTRVVLTNAIYFKSAWHHNFPEKTNNGDFTLANGDKVQVPLMNKTENLGFFDGGDVEVEKGCLKQFVGGRIVEPDLQGRPGSH